MWSRGPSPLQSLLEPALCRRCRYTSLNETVGTASKAVPVSATALQPSSQMFSVTLSTRILLILVVQWPSSGSSTSFQARESGSSKCSAFQPPSMISLTSVVVSARKTEKMFAIGRPLLPPVLDRTDIKLNSEVCESPSSPRPITPSNLKALKGSSDISVAAMNRILTQPSGISLSSPAVIIVLSLSGASPKQRVSSMNTPVTSPVPNETVIESRGWPGKTTVPS
mmetsp:Transcript_43542/g.94809  ORF Transcript_43542/g.94809 Transcript_43542/m.94809 type:complete len:225 (+) Transcript_43542:45-719(+)